MLNDFKKVGLNGLVYLITAIFSKGLNILLLPVYVKFLTVEEYGVISLLLLFKSIVVSVLGMGQIVTIKKTYYEYKRKNEDFKTFFSTIILGTVVLDVLLIILLCLSGQYIFDKFFDGISFWDLGFFILISIIFLIPYQNLLKLYQSRNESIKFSVLEIVFMLLDSAISLFLIIFVAFGPMGKVYGVLFSTIIIFIIVIPALKKEMNFKFDIKTYKKTLLIGLPIIPHSMASLLLNLSDRIFLNKANGLQVVGIYSLAYQIGQIIDIIALSFIEAWSTFFMKNVNNEDKKKIIEKFALFFIVTVGLIVLFLSFYAKEIISILFDERYREAYLIIPIIGLSFLMKTIYYITNQQMILKDKTKLLLFSTGIASAVNLFLNYLLISILNLGMYGAAIATLVSIVVMSLISYRNGQATFYIDYDKFRIISIIIVIISGIGINYVLVSVSLDSFTNKTLVLFFLIIVIGTIIPKGDLIYLKDTILKRRKL